MRMLLKAQLSSIAPPSTPSGEPTNYLIKDSDDASADTQLLFDPFNIVSHILYSCIYENSVCLSLFNNYILSLVEWMDDNSSKDLSLEASEKYGHTMIDAPVSGGVPGAAAGLSRS